MTIVVVEYVKGKWAETRVVFFLFNGKLEGMRRGMIDDQWGLSANARECKEEKKR
jgi:hypothetical protein